MARLLPQAHALWLQALPPGRLDQVLGQASLGGVSAAGYARNVPGGALCPATGADREGALSPLGWLAESFGLDRWFNRWEWAGGAGGGPGWAVGGAAGLGAVALCAFGARSSGVTAQGLRYRRDR